ncbi:MAG: DUF1499 domain-containing protein [Proteobacteria bacterium]|nr:DUF1499 domain-containing protein [Pseudomonadota bacterium]
MSEQANSSKLVNWGGYLALTFLLGLVLSILSVRGGLWQQGLLLYAVCCLGAALLLAILLICTALPGFSPWRRDLLLRCLAVLPGSILFISALMTRGDYPVIHDITTDVMNPPVFTQALVIRDKSANSLDINQETIQLQIAAYPGVQTRHSTLDFMQAFKHATTTAESMGWEITLSDSAAGIIEAVATTSIMAFKDDIVIRLMRGAENGTVIDLRSASRVGQSDLGANARRIREFMRRYKS